MTDVSLRFYTTEFKKHHHMLMYEWLLEFAKKTGIKGGSAFRAIAGFGSHGKMHEEHFFELASEVPVEIVFFLKEDEANKLLDLIKKEKVDLFYTISKAEMGRT